MKRHVLAFIIIGVFFINFHPYLSLNIKIWDEASYCLNTIDLEKGFEHLLINHRKGRPDTYSIKPPLVIFLQAFSVKAFGLNEIALRLPNFIIVILNSLLLYFIAYKITRTRLVGLITLFVFLTTNLLFIQHGIFSANLDITLMFFTSICQFLTLYFVSYHTKKKRINKYLTLFLIFFCLGFLSKGAAIFFILPGCIILYLSNLNNLKIISPLTVLILSGIFLVPISYYFISDYYYPGHFRRVINSEILRAFDSKIAGNHNRPFYYYFMSVPQHFNYYIYFVPIFFLLFKKYKFKKLIIYSGTLIISYILTLSIFEFKAIWYLIPILPVYSLFIGTLTADFFKFINDILKPQSYYIGPILLVIFLLKPSINIFDKLENNVLWYSDKNEKEGDFINYLYNSDKIKSDLLILTGLQYPHSSQLDFYIEKIHQNSNFKIEKISNFSLKTGSQLIICDSITFNDLVEKYQFSVVIRNDHCWLIHY